MTDIVERLREFEHNWSDKLAMADACQDAADEIERNRAAIDELVAALRGMRVIWATVCELQGWEPDHLPEYGIACAAIAKHQTTTEKEQ